MVTLKRINEGGVYVWTETATQLTAVGVTDSVTIEGSTDHTVQVTVATIDTNVVIQLEGSVDGTNFFILPIEDSTVSGLAISANVVTITANGTYLLYVKETAIKQIRLNFVSEAGGAAATIDSKFYSQT